MISRKGTFMRHGFLLAILMLAVGASCSKKKATEVVFPNDHPSHYTDPEPTTTDSDRTEITNVKPAEEPTSAPTSSYRQTKEADNMRGFDPASEDDTDDNGMQRYFDANDDEAWD